MMDGITFNKLCVGRFICICEFYLRLVKYHKFSVIKGVIDSAVGTFYSV